MPELDSENAKLKRLLADAMLDNVALKDLLSKNGDARREAGSCRPTGCGKGGKLQTHVVRRWVAVQTYRSVRDFGSHQTPISMSAFRNAAKPL